MTGDPAAMTSPPAGADPGSIRPLPAPSFRGTPPFPEAARRALADDQLRTNLRRATMTIRTKRQRAVDERDDWEALRVAGAAIKDDVLARLPELLIELESNVTAAGGVVHWARDAAEANRIVADLVRAAGANEVVKVKSMVTQEIELNDALARAGIAAWETDLAELIVQLGDDLPSHILVPAIHRNRTEIRDIFRRAMGGAGRPAPTDLSDEPRALAEAARLHLREKFLRARVACRRESRSASREWRAGRVRLRTRYFQVQPTPALKSGSLFVRPTFPSMKNDVADFSLVSTPPTPMRLRSVSLLPRSGSA